MLIILLILFQVTHCDILSQSSLEMCKVTSASPGDLETQMDCEKKFKILLSIDNSQLSGTDGMQFTISSVTTTDVNGTQ